MSGIAHIVARAVGDDPHTLAVLALADAMKSDGPAPVFASVSRERVVGVKAVSQLAAAKPALLVYHQQGAAPALVSRLVESRLVEHGTRLAVVHGDPRPDPIAQRDLRTLAGAGAVGVATSARAESRLHDAGFERVSRVPPVVAGERLAAVDSYAPTSNHIAVVLRGPLILTVDDVATAANAARVVQAYHVLRTYLVRAGHLAIEVPEIADTSVPAFGTLQREIWGLRLVDAWAHRLAVVGERAAYTRGAAVFVTADPASGDVRHALAAMAEGVPVVAAADERASSELGDGALLLPPDSGPALIAEAVADLLNDEARRSRLAAAASRTADRYAPETVAPLWRAALAA
jgi:hypothetical protein